MHELFLANFFAQTRALAFGKTAEEVRAEGTAEAVVPARVFEGNRPTTSIMAPALTPSVLGQLIALYEHVTFTQGIVWGIDSFDQWGVELGKQLAQEVAPAVAGDTGVLAGQDVSTRSLITYYRSHAAEADGRRTLEPPRNPLRDPRTAGCRGSPGPATLMLFGVTGDLSRKKLMPAVYDLANRGLLPPGFSLVGFARRDWADQDFAQIVHDSVKQHARTEFREEVWKQLNEGFRFVPGDFADDVAFDNLRRTLEQLDKARGTGGNHAYYLSIPPRFFSDVVAQLKEHGLAEPSTVLAAGGDREAVRLGPEDGPRAERRGRRGVPAGVGVPDRPLPRQGDRAEHPGDCGSPTTMFEPVWNANYVDHVQITMAEDIGIGGRAGYYDGIGAARDVIQNHLIQLMALIAMEEPIAFDAASLRAEKQKVLGRSCCRGGSTWPPPAGSTSRAGRAASRSAATPTSRTSPKTSQHRDVRRDHASTSTPGAGPACRSTCAPASGWAAGSPRWPWCSSGRRTCRSREHAVEDLTQNTLVIRVQPDEGVTIRFGAKVPGTACRSAT